VGREIVDAAAPPPLPATGRAAHRASDACTYRGAPVRRFGARVQHGFRLRGVQP
jgi:hypothetical protein